MNTAPPEIELLAPAGGWTQLHAAIDAGADAVYFGIDRFNMRSKAGNFREEELPEVVTALHGAGVRAYLTLNALVYERELSELREVVGYAKASFVDAVIAADIAAIEEARKTELPVHISTQMSIANSAAMAFWWDRGIRRFVLARECDLDAVARIRASMRNRYEAENMRLRIEAFAHGAMCVAVSGRCFMSGYDTGRSASRGDCAQPCRHAYEVRPVRGENEGFVVEESHVMSPRDICTLPFLEQVLDAGVNCLKIEGRNRSPDYVHTVVTAYRRAIDTYLSFRGKPELEAQLDRVKAEEMDHLSRVYNRGFSQGFYMGRPTQDWTTPPGNQSTHRRDYIGRVLYMDHASGKAVIRLESRGLKVGEEIFVESPTSGYLPWTPDRIDVEGQTVDEAEKGHTVQSSPPRPLEEGDRLYILTPR